MDGVAGGGQVVKVVVFASVGVFVAGVGRYWLQLLLRSGVDGYRGEDQESHCLCVSGVCGVRGSLIGGLFGANWWECGVGSVVVGMTCARSASDGVDADRTCTVLGFEEAVDEVEDVEGKRVVWRNPHWLPQG
ncbi:uncharacterized protein A4U43_C05F21150 [Asparagus officinalis]|uniref:Uncharacterized protein n=1 Tax=Asparagus officinalis TaxID=4686 RepID=A0A5P1ETA4_ASPOF|nr:uncharacterized protein A4U43_C05F21150 [Asparagus officinalis]